MSSLGPSSPVDSTSSPRTSHGRKRRLNSSKTKNNKTRQSVLDFRPPSKRSRINPGPSGDMASPVKTSNNFNFKANSKATSGLNKPGSKKLVIKNRKVKPDLPDNYSQVAWEKLGQSIRAIQTQQPISFSLEELYQAVENMCSHKMAAQLYDNLKTECATHIKSLVPTFQQPNLDQPQFLVMVDKQWTSHCRQMVMIRSIFLYLDRTFAVPNTSLLSIWELGLELFGKLISGQSSVLSRVLRGILTLIEKERSHESVDRGLLKSLLRMFVDLGLYQEAFELDFLADTERIYSAESVRMLQDPGFTLPEYLVHVDRRLTQESNRVMHYLHQSTRKPLILCVEKQLIGAHQTEILAKGFEGLLESSRFPDLSLLYSLYTRFREGLDILSKGFSEYIKKSGAAIVGDSERDKTMVQDLLELKLKVDTIICQAFCNCEKLHGVVREAFESVVNRRQNKPAELIAKYVDSQLKSGNKEWSDEELDRLLDRVMVLFRYIHGKDVFEAFYKKDLAKRLLLGKSASTDAEKSMLLKLKQECGPNFTNKLEGMFKDMELSKELMLSYKESRVQSQGGIDLSVSVLTMGYWPPYVPMEVVLPNQMSRYLETFKKFYLSKHSGRKLQWQPSLCHCVLKASFAHGDKELQVSLFQSLVLLLYNKTDQLNYLDIKTGTGVDDGDELKRTLQSLSLGKARVLSKAPKTRDVTPSDTFTYNKDFKHRLCRIKINQVQLKETAEENVATTEKVFQDRQYQVDAAIVRIMKMRRTLPHNVLVSECLGQLRFHVRPSDLKKRIESLIDRDYIRRSKENSSIYEYIA